MPESHQKQTSRSEKRSCVFSWKDCVWPVGEQSTSSVFFSPQGNAWSEVRGTENLGQLCRPLLPAPADPVWGGASRAGGGLLRRSRDEIVQETHLDSSLPLRGALHKHWSSFELLDQWLRNKDNNADPKILVERVCVAMWLFLTTVQSSCLGRGADWKTWC